MRRTLLVAGVVFAAMLAWECVPIQVTRSLGGYALTVHVESQAGRPRSVKCEAFSHREFAERVLADLPADRFDSPAVADPFDGQPLTVRVLVTSSESWLGRQLHRAQFRYLAVVAVLPDGRRVGKLAEIPDGRVCREVAVTLP